MIRNILTLAAIALALSATPSLAAKGTAGTKWCGSGHTLHVCHPHHHYYYHHHYHHYM
jgi:hypothetical protein